MKVQNSNKKLTFTLLLISKKKKITQVNFTKHTTSLVRKGSHHILLFINNLRSKTTKYDALKFEIFYNQLLWLLTQKKENSHQLTFYIIHP